MCRISMKFVVILCIVTFYDLTLSVAFANNFNLVHEDVYYTYESTLGDNGRNKRLPTPQPW